jgi:hypothetical protein
VQNIQNIDVLRQLALERSAQLRRATVRVSRDRSQPELRRRLGDAFVRLGAWVAAEPPTYRPAGAGAR